jgi:hypothetical protein
MLYSTLNNLWFFIRRGAIYRILFRIVGRTDATHRPLGLVNYAPTGSTII